MEQTLPVKWEEELARQAKEVAALERPSLSVISLRSGVMTYQGQQVPNNKLSCIIVASAFEHRYFSEEWDPEKISPPNCFSLSLSGQDMKPHPDVPEPISPECSGCENLEWGSAIKGKGKACKQVRRLALIPASALKEEDPSKVEMALITIPVTSGRNWANYVNSVSAEYARPPWAVISEIVVVPDPKNQFRVTFNTIGLVQESILSNLHKRVESAQQILLTPYDMSGDAEEEAPDKSKKKNKKY